MNILIADDHQLIVDDLTDEMHNISPAAKVIGTSNPAEVMELCSKYKFDVIFMDIEMPGINGITLAKKILSDNSRTNIIYVTGHEKYALESYTTFASAFLVKPVSTTALKKAMENLRFPVSNITDEMITSQFSGNALIGKKIQKYREERSMTRNEFSKLMSVSLQTIYRWENGERVPDVVMFMKICSVLGVNPNNLF